MIISANEKAAFIQKMIDQNMIQPPLGSVTYIERNPSDRKVTNVNAPTFNSYTGSTARPKIILPYKIFMFNGLDSSVTSSAGYPGTNEQ